MYDPCVKVKEETNRERIMEGKSTNIFRKMWKKYNDWPFSIFINLILISIFTFGSIFYISDTLDKKTYPYGEYELTYRVYYSEGIVKEYTITHNRPITIKSEKGTNYVEKYNDGKVIETNAPIELVRYIRKK